MNYQIISPFDETNMFVEAEPVKKVRTEEQRLRYRRNRATRYELSRPNDPKWDHFGYRRDKSFGVY